jgi:RHS repeat-associated protein
LVVVGYLSRRLSEDMARAATNYYTAGEYGQIDQLTYYYNSKNQVLNITDGAVDFNGPNSGKDYKGFVYNPSASLLDNNVTGGNHYAYDNNGNLLADLHKDITLIEYNFLNLPQVITFTGGRTIQFVYDASGAKLKKITNDNGTIVTYDYINGAEYKNNVLQRFAHSEGSVARNSYGAFEHEYVLRDHLGNARVTFTDGTNKGDAYYDWNLWPNYYVDPNVGNTTGYNDGIITSADIKQVNNYYSFGLNMEGNWQGGAQGDNKYQYNEKELNTDFGLNWNDYGARMYDAAMGRWLGVDHLAEKYNIISPYSYVANNPIRAVDPDGADIIVINGRDGKQADLFKAHLNSFFDGKVSISVSSTNVLEIGSLKPGANLNESQQYLYNRLSSMINNHEKTAQVTLSSDHEPIDDYSTANVDPSSIDKFSATVSEPAGQASWYLHFFEEQWHKQVELGLPAFTYSLDNAKAGPGCPNLDCGYTESHVVALASQFKMTGAFVGGEKSIADNNGKQITFMYVNKAGQYVSSHNFIYSVNGIGKSSTTIASNLVGKVPNIKPSRTDVGGQITTIQDYSGIVKSVIKLLQK